jgi:hypothetical protein
MQRRDERPRVYLGHNLRFSLLLVYQGLLAVLHMKWNLFSDRCPCGTARLLLRADYFRKDESPLLAG